jgi:hypothetical protein
MTPNAIYSKTGKGVQEASGKTSLLSRGDRAILAAIDGKISLQQLSAKFDRRADEAFFGLIRKMDADGFIREVSAGTVQRGAANAPRTVPPKPASKPAGGGGEDLDFTQIFSQPPKIDRPSVPASKPPAGAPSSKDPMAAARDAAEQRTRAEREAKAKADAAAKADMMSTQQFRLDAELRAKVEREKVMAAAAEGKTRAEIEARQRAEAEAKAKAEADAKARADAAARAKVEIERQAQERAEREAREAKARAEREAREKVEAGERARRDTAERARREAEELRFKVEEERRAREDAERRAREEAERTKREAAERARREEEERKALAEAEELRKKLDEERKAREEAERRAEEERKKRDQVRAEEERKAREVYEREEAARRAADEAAQKARDEQERKEAEEHQRQIRLAREAEDKKRRDADARRKKEEEAKRWEVEEARRKADDSYRVRAEQEDKARAEREVVEAVERVEAEKKAAQEADALAGSLLVDLDSFSQRQDEERKATEEEDRKARIEAERQAKEEQARREREEAERKAKKAEERRRREEEEARQREEAEQREREEEARQKEAEAERKRKERELSARNQEVTDIPISSADLDRGDVEEDSRKLAPEARKALRDREREVARARNRGDVSGKKAAVAYKRKQPTQWGKPVAIFLFLTLVIGAGVANFIPLDTREYEKVATEAVGVPVKIGAARMWVLNGVQLRFERVSVGDAVKIAEVRAVPEFSSLLGEDKVFTRLEFDKAVVQQAALGEVLFGGMKQGRLQVARVVAKDVRLEGPLALPPMDIDASVGPSGKLFSIRLSGERVNGLITPRDGKLGFEVSMGSFDVPFLDKLSLVEFGMKGSADREGVTLTEFDGRLYDGTVVGKARIEWGAQWSVQGEIQGRTMNAAVFSPQMVSEGRFDGKGRFAMSGPEPAKLHETARLDGEFTVGKGALSSFDLSRALQSASAQASGRTPFSELEGRVSLVAGALAFRDLKLTAGLLNAKGALDVDPKGGLSGRVDAELRNLRGTFYIGGKLGDPQLRR